MADIPAWTLANGDSEHPRITPASCSRCGQREGAWSMAEPDGKGCHWRCLDCGQVKVWTRRQVLRALRSANSSR